MSRFYVGQRVRLARPTHERNRGNTGTIQKFGEWPCGTRTRLGGLTTADTDCLVLWDYKASTGISNLQHTDQLEPLTDPGREVVSWSDERCVWQPEHLRQPA
jgi:hypothetical protein